ncbi:phosphogluconate dehydrogenase (NAD(+)-dependent, decarboxylating) [Salibacterium salarium]|uniref:phosphogluconate dehydrogenase (NAD(+)-dependent, decarboxylating) n=1 Tax=Salibacterium salarium TaxID=284579 RepID=UPI003521473A
MGQKRGVATMKLGIVGLGKMGYNVALNCMDHGHSIVANDVNESAITEAEKEGATGVKTYAELVQALEAPRVIWVMVPEGDPTDESIRSLSEHLSSGDIVIDAGNSNYKDTVQRAQALKEKGIALIDAGTSGGTDGARHGACIMAGGELWAIQKVESLFEEITTTDGYLHTGEPGSGHYLKMIHNGIEYGMMHSIAEGFELLEKSSYDFDYESVARLWNNGSVIRSWLMELTQSAFSKDSDLSQLRGVMNSSGEGKWTVEAALENEVATPVIALSLMMRYRSQENDTFTGKVVAALRNEFGGHSVVNSK